MPVLLESTVSCDDINYREFKIIRNVPIENIQNRIDYFMNDKFEENPDIEIEFISSHYIHDGDFSFKASEITESEAATIEKLFGTSYGHGLISHLDF